MLFDDDFVVSLSQDDPYDAAEPKPCPTQR
jgi:hypothetical protein